MAKGRDRFMLGAATAAHQVEGNNRNSDCWAMEQMAHSAFVEPSLDAVDHYNRYQEDIDYLAGAGLNAYRFSIEWARIEPEKGKYDETEVRHYRDVLNYCRKKGIEPMVTMHHFSSPRWLMKEGGWEAESTAEAFADYCAYVSEKLGDLMLYVCTINEANMGFQLSAMMQAIMKQMEANLQIGMNLPSRESAEEERKETETVFGTDRINPFLSPRTEEGDRIIMRAHEKARDAMKRLCPHLKIGITMSLFDVQTAAGGEAAAEKEWADEFGRYVPYIRKDDFFGLQNYTRKVIGREGTLPAPAGAELTQMDYEFYPKSLGNVVRRVYAELGIPIVITENGVATEDDARRIVFVGEALECVKECLEEGIPVEGYFYWSLLDNFEWQKGFGKQFGLIAVDRKTQKRYPKESLGYMGRLREQMKL